MILRIDWTGERFVHGAGDDQLWYEHAHRYALAVGMAAGRRVVDVGCGEGYGAAWIATGAASTLGIDIEPAAIDHAAKHYRSENLSFAVGDARHLDLPDACADLVTCFETIEHVSEPAKVLDELARILAPGGVVIISTPDAVESDGTNPFHLHELTAAELTDELERRFTHRMMFGQRVSAASHMWALDGPEVLTVASNGIVLDGTVPRLTNPHQRAVYLVAVCSQDHLDQRSLAGPAALVDPADGLLSDLRGQLVRGRNQLQSYEIELEARAKALGNADVDLVRARSQLQAYEAEIAAHVVALAGQAELEQELTALQAETASLRSELDGAGAELRRRAELLVQVREEAEHALATAAEQADAVQTRARSLLAYALRNDQEVATTQRELQQTRTELARVTAELAEERGSAAGRLLAGYRRRLDRALPPESARRRLYLKAHGLAARTPPTTPVPESIVVAAAPAPKQVAFVTDSVPLVSIVIPVFGRLSTTLRCLESIASAPTAVGYEVIVVDDASPDGSADALAEIDGVRLIAHSENLGYLHSTNDGAAVARGEFLVLLNNDTTVTAGWLDALVEAAADPQVGAVGAKLLYPDGSLSEAGGIVFADGSPWIYGRGDDPADPRYAWLREVDYCSAACLLVRRNSWTQLAGFDPRYEPAYYEDTDLCFRLREHGQKVVYQPKAVVVHEEGGTHGASTDDLGLRLRAHNHVKFVGRWQAALSDQQLPGRDFRARRRGPDRSVLVVDHHLPTPDLDSGSVRMRRLLTLLRAADRHVCFIPHNPLTFADYADPLRQAGIEIVDPRADLGRWLGDLAGEVDLVVLSRPDVAEAYLPAVRQYLPDAVIVYDMVDYHALREQRRRLLFGEQDTLGLAEVVRDAGNPVIGAVEAVMCRTADIVVAISDHEADLIRAAHPGATVIAVPNIHDEPLLNRSFANRRGFVFVGGYDHPPNRDAVHVLVTEIWPRIRQALPDAPLHLVGSNMTPDIAGLAGNGVIAHGWVADLSTVLGTTRVFLAPLRYGAGIKGKVGQAMSAGLPVVTTSVGAEGMNLPADDAGDMLRGGAPHLTVEDDLQAFAEAAVALHQDEARWTQQVGSARDFIDLTLSPAAVSLRVDQVLQCADKLLADPERRRGRADRPVDGNPPVASNR